VDQQQSHFGLVDGDQYGISSLSPEAPLSAGPSLWPAPGRGRAAPLIPCIDSEQSCVVITGHGMHGMTVAPCGLGCSHPCLLLLQHLVVSPLEFNESLQQIVCTFLLALICCHCLGACVYMSRRTSGGEVHKGIPEDCAGRQLTIPAETIGLFSQELDLLGELKEQRAASAQRSRCRNDEKASPYSHSRRPPEHPSSPGLLLHETTGTVVEGGAPEAVAGCPRFSRLPQHESKERLRAWLSW
jgi:hypothetical protein